MKTSIIVPAHNEEKSIKKFLLKLSDNFKNSEIIVVCNGCTDRTPEIVKSIKRKNIKSVILPEKGKGRAILAGLSLAKGDYLGFVDADGSFSPEDIKKILNELKNSKCVIASKWKGKKFSEVDWPLGRKLAGRIWNFLANFLLSLNVKDTQAGLKFFTREVWEKLDKDFICKGFEFDVELLKKIKDKGFEIKEVYVPVKKTNKTTFSFRSTPKMFFNLIRIWMGV